MPKKFKRVLALAGTAVILSFFVSMVFVLSMTEFLQDFMRAYALVSGAVGLSIWVIITIDNKKTAGEKEMNDEIDEQLATGAKMLDEDIEAGKATESEQLLTEKLSYSKANIARAAQSIRRGEIVAFGTETVYGLGASALNPAAVAKIFEAKGRPQDNPLIVHLAKVEDIPTIAEIDEKTIELLKKLMPSPLTVVLNKKPVVPDSVTAGLSTVAVRVPLSDKAREFIASAGVPIAAPSANLSGRPSPTTAEHVMKDLSGKLKFVLDFGECKIGLESTVIDLTVNPPALLRHGGVPLEAFTNIFEKMDVETKQNGAPKSPGVKYRHYAPAVPVEIFKKGHEDEALQKYDSLVKNGEKPVLTALESFRALAGDRSFMSLGATEDEAAKSLYQVFRTAETVYDTIIALELAESGLGVGVNDRLRKSAADNL